MNTSQRTNNVETKARVLWLNIIRFSQNARYHMLFPLSQTVDRIASSTDEFTTLRVKQENAIINFYLYRSFKKY
jgi:hypothetical protein